LVIAPAHVVGMTIEKHVSVPVAAVVVVVLSTLVAPAHASGGGYGWPLKPFGRQHPVRGHFGDPRINGRDEAHGRLHFGIDIVSENGTPVYATISGIASIHPLHRDTAVVRSSGAITHEYWHVIPSIQPGQRVIAFHTVVGRIEAPWRHVHFAELVCGCYVNPLRPGAVTPYSDTTHPAVDSVSFERDGTAVGPRLSGSLDLVAEAWDEVPLAVPLPWNAKPVAPAIVRWRLQGRRATGCDGWRTAVDFSGRLPGSYRAVYARGTRQNHPWRLRGSGRYRFVLARAFDTRLLEDGRYRVQVEVEDTRGNRAVGGVTVTIANDR
jgi:hypothetical protein